MKIRNEWVLTGCALFIAIALLSNAVWDQYRKNVIPIVQLHDDYIEQSVIHAGENLYLRRAIIREKICDTIVNDFFIRKLPSGDETVVYRNSMVGGWSRLGKSVTIREVFTPKDLPPGKYYLRTLVQPRCGDGTGLASLSDDVEFTIAPNSEKLPDYSRKKIN
jgi:hypothetical protein